MPIISTVGLFCCDKFEETQNGKVVNMSKLTKSYFKANEIFEEQYIKGMTGIIMMDKEFDQKELVLLLTTLNKVFAYVEPFKYSLNQIHNGQMVSNSEYQEFSKRIKFVEESIHFTVLELIDHFCKSQKPKFLHFINEERFFANEIIMNGTLQRLDTYCDTDNLLGQWFLHYGKFTQFE